MKGRPAAVRSQAGQPAGTPCATCKAKQQAKPAPPCDFDKIEVKCKHCGKPDKRDIKSVIFALNAATGARTNNLQRSPNPRRALITRRFEVAGDDEVTITLAGGPGYHGAQHPMMMLTGPAGVAPVVVRGRTQHVFKLVYAHGWVDRALAATRSRDVFAGLRELLAPPPSDYRLDVLTCGARPQPHVFRRFEYGLIVYPPDTFKIAIALPSWKKVERKSSTSISRDGRRDESSRSTAYGLSGRETARSESTYDSQRGYVVRQTDTQADRSGGTQRTQTLAESRGGSFSHKDRTGKADATDGLAKSTGKTLTVTHDSKDISSSLKVVEFVEFIADLRANVMKFWDFLQSLTKKAPKIGWSLSLELEFLSGSFEYEWGYREWKDHSVYQYWKAEAALTIASIRAEIAFGLTVLGVNIQVFGAFVAELKVSGAKEADPDRTGPALTFSQTVNPGLEVGVRGALGDWVKVIGKIAGNLDIANKMELAPFKWTVKIDLAEGKGTLTLTSKFGFNRTSSASLWDKYPILPEKTVIG